MKYVHNFKNKANEPSISLDLAIHLPGPLYSNYIIMSLLFLKTMIYINEHYCVTVCIGSAWMSKSGLSGTNINLKLPRKGISSTKETKNSARNREKKKYGEWMWKMNEMQISNRFFSTRMWFEILGFTFWKMDHPTHTASHFLVNTHLWLIQTFNTYLFPLFPTQKLIATPIWQWFNHRPPLYWIKIKITTLVKPLNFPFLI